MVCKGTSAVKNLLICQPRAVYWKIINPPSCFLLSWQFLFSPLPSSYYFSIFELIHFSPHLELPKFHPELCLTPIFSSTSSLATQVRNWKVAGHIRTLVRPSIHYSPCGLCQFGSINTQCGDGRELWMTAFKGKCGPAGMATSLSNFCLDIWTHTFLVYSWPWNTKKLSEVKIFENRFSRFQCAVSQNVFPKNHALIFIISWYI